MREIELSSVITDIAAGPFGSNLKVECFVPSGFPIVDGANLKSYKVTDNITKFVTEKKARSLGRSIAKRGDVIVTISGTLGQISYIPDDSKYTEYLCSQRQFRVSFDENKVYAPYLVFYFHTYEGQNKILSFANQTGVPALSQPLKNFKKIRLQLPPLEQQKKIASVIEAINRKIEYNQKINDNLRQQAAALFANFYDRAETEVGFTEIIQILGGGTPKTGESSYWNGNVPFFTPKDVGSPYTLATEKTITEEGLAHCNSRLYCCYELTSIADRSIFQSFADAIIAVEWNHDVNYYSNIIESLSRDVHCYCIQVNTSDYGDSRITQPTKTEKKDILRTKGGANAAVLVGKIEIAKLREFQAKTYELQKDDSTYKPTPPNFNSRIAYQKSTGQLSADIIKELFT